MNIYKTAFLMAAMTALFAVIGFALGGQMGMIMALGMAGIGNVFAYWNSDKAILSMYQAQPVTSHEAPEIYQMVARLTQRAGMPMPKIYILDTPQPNAFATGRNPENAAVAVTTSLMHMLTSSELEGVIAHELAHIKNRDTLVMTITATLAGAIGALANIAMFSSMFGGNNAQENEEGTPQAGGGFALILVAMLAPMAASLVQMMISRTREYEADRVGAEICGQPMALASALAKIESSVRGHHQENTQAENNPATAHLFIINPLLGKMDSLFSTHPNTSNRIEALKELAQQMGQAEIFTPPSPNSFVKSGTPWG